MMEESGRLGLLLATREVLGIERIDALHASIDGGIWLDVTLLSGKPDRKHLTLLLAGDQRCRASINASRVVAAWGAGNRRDLALGGMLQTGKPI